MKKKASTTDGMFEINIIQQSGAKVQILLSLVCKKNQFHVWLNRTEFGKCVCGKFVSPKPFTSKAFMPGLFVFWERKKLPIDRLSPKPISRRESKILLEERFREVAKRNSESLEKMLKK